MELLMALWIMGVAMAMVIPNFMRAIDHAHLQKTAGEVVCDLRLQQVKAQELQSFQEVRFAPFSNFYQLYGDGEGVLSTSTFEPTTSYFEGYLHLPQPTVRFDDNGNVSESGQIGFVDPEGDVMNLVVHLQYGEVEILHHMVQ